MMLSQEIDKQFTENSGSSWDLNPVLLNTSQFMLQVRISWNIADLSRQGYLCSLSSTSLPRAPSSSVVSTSNFCQIQILGGFTVTLLTWSTVAVNDAGLRNTYIHSKKAFMVLP